MDFCLDGPSVHQDIEATDLQGSDFDKADCSYADLAGAHMQDAVNVNNACFAPPTPDVAGVWSIGVGAEASAKVHLRTEGRAIDGKATFFHKGELAPVPGAPVQVDAAVSGRLDRITTADARGILQAQSEKYAAKKGAEANVPVQRGLGMPVARFRMEFRAASGNADKLLKAVGDVVASTPAAKKKMLLAYVGTVWLVDTAGGKEEEAVRTCVYSLRGFVLSPICLPPPPPVAGPHCLTNVFGSVHSCPLVSMTSRSILRCVNPSSAGNSTPLHR